MFKFSKDFPLRGLVLLIMTSLLLAGCQSIESYYRGYKVTNESIVSLSDSGQHQSSWTTFDINMVSQHEQTGNVLNVSGTVDLGLYYELNVGLIKSLQVFLFFLDEEYKVLQTVELADSFSYRTDQQLAFDARLPVPAGAKSIGFGYRGVASGGGGNDGGMGMGGGGDEAFDDLPKRPRK